MVFSAIDAMNLGYVLNDPKPEDNPKNLPCWEIGNKQVRYAIHSILLNELVDVYCQYKVTKEIWNVINKKYILKDVGTQKYVIKNFRKFQMTKDKDVSSQIHDYHLLINDLVNENINLPKPFVVEYLIETLLNS